MFWWEFAARQAGVVTQAQFVAGGRGLTAVSRAADRDELTRLCRGVYLVGGAPYTMRARLWAAVLATDGTLCRQTAGRLWDVLDLDDPHVHVHVPHERRISIPAGVRLHRCAPWGSVRERSGLPVFDRSATVVELLAEQPKRPGNAQLRRLLAQLSDGAAAESERLLHGLMRRADIDGWCPNYEVWSAGELVTVVDVALPARRIAIEVDGMAYHTDVDRFRRDRTRQNALVALGWTVLRFTWADLTERPGYVIATLRRIAA